MRRFAISRRGGSVRPALCFLPRAVSPSRKRSPNVSLHAIDYVLTGGELPAMVVADAVVRLIPGALGDEMSNVDESFSTAEDGGLLEYAQYTRPAEFNGEGVPPVLVSGDHAKVDAWRRKNAIERTCRWRPDLIETARLTPEERAYAQEILDASYSQSEE